MKLSVYLDNLLAMLQRGSLTKLAVSLPPRSGKTSAVIRGVGTWIAERPGDQIMVSSYSPEQTRRLAKLVQGEAVRRGAGDSRVPYAVAVGGSATGIGADLVVIDDPIKDKRQGDSWSELKRIWEWIESVALARMHAGSRVLVIGSRWSAYDPIGRILAGHAGEGWTVVNVSAVALQDDPLGRSWGELLWTEGRTGTDLLKTRRDFGAVNWATTWQGRPPDDGFPVSADPRRS